jgi:hypothetical protein
VYNSYVIERTVEEHHRRDASAPRPAPRGLKGAEVERTGVGRVFESWRRIAEGETRG